MDNKILVKVKEHLLFNSKVYKERQKLINEYVSNIERITYEILGEKGKEMIEKYPDAIEYYSYIKIPCFYRHLGQSGYYCGEQDRVDINLPCAIYGLNNSYSATIDCGTDEDKEWSIKIKEKLEENGKQVESLCSMLDETLKSTITVTQLQNNFPEAYKIYQKLKTNEK